MAAGGSTRLDSPKQLLKWGNDYLINHIIRIVSSANIDSIYLILGSHAEEIRKILIKQDISILINPDWQRGMSSSIKTGLAALPADVDAAFILLVDQPFITSTLLSQLIQKISPGNFKIAAPRVGQQQCNPVLFHRDLFPEIMQISGDKGAKALLSAKEVGWVDWSDKRLMLDIDSKDDYRKALGLMDN
jgi:molybdenum cofactor cytidylyltransferase